MAIDPWTTFGTMLGVWCTLAIFTLPVYGENVMHRLSEALFLGVGTAYTTVTSIRFIINTGIGNIQLGKWYYLLSIILGLLMFARLSKKYAWVSRYPIAVVTGLGTGLVLRGAVSAQIVEQIRSTVTLPIFNTTIYNSINNLLIIIFTMAALTFFIFEERISRPLAPVRKLGRYVLLAAFGSGLAGAVGYRSSLHIGRHQYLWTTTNKPFTLWIGLFVVIVLAVEYTYTRRKMASTNNLNI